MAKIKSKRDVVMTLQHNTRDRMPQNADPQRTSSNWTKGGNTLECVARFDDLMPEKIRKNAVLAVELVLTASPDFPGDWTKYLIACDKWAMQTFGINPEKNDVRPVVHIAHHRDEETPHTHITLVPLKDGKLNAKHFIGGSRDRMAELQNDFFEKVGKEFGLARGQSRAETKAKHNPHTLAGKAADLEKREKKLNEVAADFKRIFGITPKDVAKLKQQRDNWDNEPIDNLVPYLKTIKAKGFNTHGEFRIAQEERKNKQQQKSGFHR